MASEIGTAVAVDAVTTAAQPATAARWELKLVRKTSARLLQPHKRPKEIVEDLLARLLTLRRRRDLNGQNHWEEFAPAYFQRMLVRHEALRRRAIAEFFQIERDHAVARAQAILGNRSEAEDAVGEAFARLLKGKVGPGHFYRVLSQVCMDLIRKRNVASKVIRRDNGPDVSDDESLLNVAAYGSISDGDPLDILVREEDIREGIRKVKTESKYRDTRRLDWWQELLSHHCPGEVEGKGAAQTHR